MQTAQDAARALQEQLDAARQRADESKEKTAQAERDLADVNLALEGQKREAAELQAKARLRDAEAQASTELHKEELAEARRRRDRDLETEQQKHAAEVRDFRSQIQALNLEISTEKAAGERVKRKETSSLQSDIEVLAQKERQLALAVEESERKLATARNDIKKEKDQAQNRADEAELLKVENREQRARADVIHSEKFEASWALESFVSGKFPPLPIPLVSFPTLYEVLHSLPFSFISPLFSLKKS
ncbi:hypothetical protein DIPPA_13578 [Diplonema papillatum]|nr:hypothetical protein DIPPA_13578 [Diplonema papillatum]